MANTVFDFWLMAMQDTAGELGPTVGNHTHNKIYSASFADSHRACPVIVAEDVESGDGSEEEEGEEEAIDVMAPQLRSVPPSSSRESGDKLYILMLTNFMENGRPKCATYFPGRPGQTLCFYSGSGSESQCEAASCATASSSSTTTKDDDDDEEEEDEHYLDGGVGDGEDTGFREWYEQSVRDRGRCDEWQWVKSLRRGSGLSAEGTQSESCFIVRNVGLREETGYSVRDLSVKYVHGPARRSYTFLVEHYWFPDWPDHKSPGDLSVVLDFALDLLRVPGLTMSLRTPEPCPGSVSGAVALSGAALGAKVVLPILHCSAGIGRTGCMAGILNALRQMHSGTCASSSSGVLVSSPSQSQTVDILGIVCNLRLQRGGMVQNSEQYELIHRVLCLYQQKADEAVGLLQPASFLQPKPAVATEGPAPSSSGHFRG